MKNENARAHSVGEHLQGFQSPRSYHAHALSSVAKSSLRQLDMNARIQIHEQVTEPNWGRRPIDELLCACMHARALCAAAAAVHAFSLNSVELGMSNDSF